MKQAGRGGIGTVFRNKKIKALVCKIPGVKGNLNNVVDLEAIMERGKRFNREMRELDAKQCQMREIGTAHLMEIMNDHDLLPVMNYKFGSHPDSYKIDSSVWKRNFTQNIPDGCWIGCNMSCSKGIDDFILKTGPYKGQKVIVDGPEYENAAGLGSNCGIFDPEYIIETNFYCDTYGICTITWSTFTAFIMECFQNGILNKERTGGLNLNFGNSDAALEMLHQLARGEGFGKIAGTGVRKMKELFIKNGWGDPAFLNDIGMEKKGLNIPSICRKNHLHNREDLPSQIKVRSMMKHGLSSWIWSIIRYLHLKIKLKHFIIFLCSVHGSDLLACANCHGMMLNLKIMPRLMNLQKCRNMSIIM